MAANLAVNAKEFEEKVLNSEVPVLVDFWAPWCMPCRTISPIIESLAGDYAGRAKVFKVDVDSDPEIAMRYNVMSIPALIVFKGGKVVNQLVGAAPRDRIAALIDNAL